MTLQKPKIIQVAISITTAIVLLAIGIPLAYSVLAAIITYIGIMMYMKKQTNQQIEKTERTSQKYKIIGITILVIAVSIIGISTSIGSNNSDSNEKSIYEIEEDEAKKITKIVQNYKGKDGKGDTLLEALVVLVNASYRNENILDNPSTEIAWYSIEDISLRNNDGSPIDGVYKVGFNVKTYKENIEFVWYYNTQTKEIFAGNEHGKSVLDIVDTFD